MEFKIREATSSDAPYIHEMIKELCTYEKTPLSEVQITPEDLVDDGFKDNGLFKCMVAEIPSNFLENERGGQSTDQTGGYTIVGYALYYFGYSTWKGKFLYLEDIYVKPNVRGNGIGTAFFKKLGQIALEMKCCRMVFICLDWNDPSKEFYVKLGAEEQPEWKMFHFRNEQIKSFTSR